MQYGSLTLDNLKQEANRYFSGDKNLNDVPDEAAMRVANIDPANDAAHRCCFAKWVRSNMIIKIIQGWVSADSWTRLELRKKDFAWRKGDEWVYNGPTMLFIILTKLNPSSNVGVTEEINFIENVTLKQFNGN
eukprot:1962049-Ditylum_brightwellii.AAC.1